MTSFLDSLSAEIQQVEAKLKADPTFIKWERLVAVRKLYMEDQDASGETPNAGVLHDHSKLTDDPPSNLRRVRRSAPERIQAIEVTKQLLSGKKYPVKTSDLYANIVAHNIQLSGAGEAAQQNNFSSLLYHSGEFQSHGRAGWTLKNTEAPDPTQEWEGSEASSANSQPSGDEARERGE